MSGRSLLILLLLFAAAVAFVVWFDPADDPAGDAEGPGRLPDHPVSDLGALEVARGSGAYRIERVAGAWRLVRPFAAEVDPRRLESFVGAIGTTRIHQVVEDQASDLAGFGLSEPETSVRLFSREGSLLLDLGIGATSPLGPERYVSIGEARVLLVEGTIAQALGREAGHFRERRLFPIDRAEIRSLVLERAGERTRLSRPGREWRMAEPVTDRVDPRAVEQILDLLDGLSVIRFAEGRELDELARRFVASRTIEVGTADGAEPLRVEIGERAAADEWYARRGDGSLYGTIAGAEAEELNKDPDSFRERALVFASRPEVREIRISSAGRTVVVRRETEGAPWSVEDGTGASREAERDRVVELLDQLRWLRVREFGPEPRDPSDSAGEVVLKGENGELGRIRLDAVSAEDPASFRVWSSWRPGRVFTVTSEALQELPETIRMLTVGAAEGEDAATGNAS